jgi:hypothetical protein
MKQHNHILHLSGYGFLYDILDFSDKKIARIKTITPFDSSSQGKDDVWIEGEISNKDQLARLKELLSSVRTGAKVLITFKASYRIFTNAYAGQTPEDPNHIVILQSTLSELCACYIDGCLVEESSFSSPLAVA